jgi:hypothetical protein
VTATTTAGGGGSGDPVIAAAGDIACDPTTSGFSINGTATKCRMKYTSDLVLAMDPDAVLTLGDHQYENNAFSKYAGSYDPTWGRFKSITHPSVGNHEYLTANAAGHFQYWGAKAGDPAKGYYSFDLGAWHIISLNAECARISGGCTATGAQGKWLKADLDAHPARCTMAYFHRPLFSSGAHSNDPSSKPLWTILHAEGADVILSGHDHNYERFAPQDENGAADAATGIREFVVGTGGKDLRAMGTRKANSEVLNTSTHGVLKMTLHATSYDFEFVPEAGKTFRDSGSANCH